MAKIDPASTKRYIDELRHAVLVASLNYDVWWAFKSKENRDQYLHIMNKYLNFFATGINAHFVALLIPLYRLYENKADTYNIPKLLEYLRQDNHLPPTVIGELDGWKVRADPLWEKVKILRNRAFGHRSRAHTTEELFIEAHVTPDDLKDLIGISKSLLNVLSSALYNDTHAFNSEASGDTVRLLEHLKSLHSSNG